MEELKKTIETALKALECSDDSDTVSDYIYNIVTDSTSDESEKKQSLFEFLLGLTEKDFSGFLDEVLEKYNELEKSNEDVNKKLKETIKLQQAMKIKETVASETCEEEAYQKEEQKKRDYILSKYGYEEEDVDENGDILLSDHHQTKKDEEQKTRSGLAENNNTKRIIDEEKARREKAKIDNMKRVERDKEALAKQRRDEEKKKEKTAKKEKRRMRTQPPYAHTLFVVIAHLHSYQVSLRTHLYGYAISTLTHSLFVISTPTPSTLEAIAQQEEQRRLKMHHTAAAANIAEQKQRIILSVKVPEVGLTKKILFDQVETVDDAIGLIIEKLPPGCLDFTHYNIYMPQKNKWCKLDTPFSKYQFKENQEIEFKRDNRGGVAHLLTSVGNILKPTRTLIISLPEIVQVGLGHGAAPALSLEENGELMGSERSFASSAPSTPLRTSSDAVFAKPSINVHRSATLAATSSSSLSINVPKLNLSSLSAGTTPRSRTASLSSSPRNLESKKSFMQLIGLSPRASPAPSNPASAQPSPRGSPSNSAMPTPRGMPGVGTFARSEVRTIVSFDVEEDTTIKELLHRIYARFPSIERELLDDYNLATSDNVFLSDRNKTIAGCNLHHLDELSFLRQTQNVKIIFLNREVILPFAPTDRIGDIALKFRTTYLPNLMRLHRSPTIVGQNTIGKNNRSSLSLDPAALEAANAAADAAAQPPALTGTTRSHRSYSDTSPLNFTRTINSVNSTEHSIDTIKRKNSVAPPPAPELGAEFRDFRFHLCTKNSNPNITHRHDLMLDEDRTLASFNFWNNVRLHFRNGSAGGHRCRIASMPCYVTVEAPDNAISVQYVLEIESSARVADVIHSFVRQLEANTAIKITDALEEYGLYMDTMGDLSKEGIEYGSSLLLDAQRPLASYPIDPLDKLIFKRTNQIFARSSDALPQALDAGISLTVPAILVTLRDKLRQLDGYKQEGIFRLSSSDSSMLAISEALERGTLLDESSYKYAASSSYTRGTIDAHAIASFIKRWYMKLPVKLCAHFDEDTLRYAASLEEAALHTLQSSMDQPNRSLLMWIVHLLADVAQNASLNKMSAKNLAIVIAPILLSSSSSSSSSSSTSTSTSSSSNSDHNTPLERHQLATMFLQHLIKHSLREKGFIPLSSSTISNTSTSFMSTLSNGSASPITSSFMSRSPSLTDMSEDN
eukprot:gene6093-7058_t